MSTPRMSGRTQKAPNSARSTIVADPMAKPSSIAVVVFPAKSRTLGTLSDPFTKLCHPCDTTHVARDWATSIDSQCHGQTPSIPRAPSAVLKIPHNEYSTRIAMPRLRTGMMVRNSILALRTSIRRKFLQHRHRTCRIAAVN